ncbi:phosphoglycerate dehydrogenase [Ruminococcus sp. OA3]|uniref:NAD(P)-dependent oxidoreductase n=1 Tax=Ruminococcus sp. OA3 TaxID=2914164 RepID=UPI001F05F29A|nr:NAD(P)-dependent oxidoreductase [Ruminococcus sp. OA3]MCH1982395.1 phosphoglycerate dehydrogenase [Ruminococcus sp. OA3]
MPYDDYDPMHSGHGLKILEGNGIETAVASCYLNNGEILEIIDQYDAVIYCGGFSPDARFFSAAKRLKILSRLGVGFDEIDLKAAAQHGIQVTITRVMEHINGVAELAYALMMTMLYHIPQRYSEYVIKKEFRQITENRQLCGKTVGLFGFGAIAKALAGQLAAAGVKLIACDMYPDPAAANQLNVKLVAKEQLLAESDIISIHVPALPENRHIFNTAVFSQMKKGAFIVNTARGMLVNEHDLYDALKSGKLSGAAVDVMDPEPADPCNPLLTLDNFIATPHIGGNNYEAREAMSVSAAQAVVDSLNGQKPYFLLNS